MSIIFLKGGNANGKNISAQKASEKGRARFPQENGDKERPQGARKAQSQRKKDTDLLIRFHFERSAFLPLSGRSSVDSGAVCGVMTAAGKGTCSRRGQIPAAGEKRVFSLRRLYIGLSSRRATYCKVAFVFKKGIVNLWQNML